MKLIGEAVRRFALMLGYHKTHGWDEKHWQWECSKPRKDCGCPYDSFWKTVVESPQWKAWDKEVARRMAEHTAKRSKKYYGCYDVDECAYCGWISKEHFQSFMQFFASQEGKKAAKGSMGHD